MELVYLWVEDYKNIKKQGFDFSPKFKCNFKAEYEKDSNNHENLKNNCELHLEPKDHIENFFGNNINITAVVGKNGSGKSTLLKLFIGGIFQNKENWRNIKNLLLVFNINDQIKIFTFSGIKKNNKFIDFNVSTSIGISSESIYIDNKLSCEPNIFLMKNFYLLMDFSIGQQDIWNDYDKYKTNFALEPSRIYKSTGGAGITSKVEPAAFDSVMKVNVIYFYKYIYEHGLESILKDFNLPAFRDLQYISASSKGTKTKEENFKELKSQKYDIFGISFSKMSQWQDVNQNIKEYFEKDIDITSIKINDLSKLDMVFIFSNIEMTVDGIYFYQLSTGQQLLISYLGIIIRTYLNCKDNKDTFNIILDEIETSLHPDWQKKSLNFICKFITKVGINEHFTSTNIITTTHSPFILSDLPRKNVIFLEDGKQIDANIDTFGANIHTLLAHGFFMNDGLIGEFAKEKINYVINYLNDKESEITDNDTAKKYINLIGEPILKRQLQKMLDSKLISRINEIDELKRRIEILESQK